MSLPNQQLDTFYNTVNLSGKDLKEARHKAGSLNAMVLEFFVNNHCLEFTPAQIWVALGQQYPLTSVRRAITTLTPDWLERTENKRPGLYGNKPHDMNHTWKLKTTK